MKIPAIIAFVLSFFSAAYAGSVPAPVKMPASMTQTAKGTGIRFVTPEGEPVKFIRASISIDAGSQGLPDIMVTSTVSDSWGFIPVKVTAGAKYRIRITPDEYYIDGLKAETGVVTTPLEQGVNDISLKKPLKQELTVSVRDFDTKMPVMKAEITETRNYGGEFRKPGIVDRGIGLTNRDGVFYTDEFNPDHVSRFGASAEGYYAEWLDIDSFQPGGSYEFELKKIDNF